MYVSNACNLLFLFKVQISAFIIKGGYLISISVDSETSTLICVFLLSRNAYFAYVNSEIDLADGYSGIAI